MAQDERSLSLTLGSKGLHLTLADRQTKDFLWEHLRKMREQAREQAKASRLTRASSIDHINIGDDVKGWVAMQTFLPMKEESCQVLDPKLFSMSSNLLLGSKEIYVNRVLSKEPQVIWISFGIPSLASCRRETCREALTEQLLYNIYKNDVDVSQLLMSFEGVVPSSYRNRYRSSR